MGFETALFFRGQSSDYKNKANRSTFYPTIYRGDYVSQKELDFRFARLSDASRNLVETFDREKINGAKELRRKRLIQWSVLQHYEVCETPLLDFTHSLRVAASFAQLGASDREPVFVYVFGLPYLTNRISNNSEHDLVNIRLLSICPPSALRPHFQEGYLAGTEDIESNYENKTELDFNNRLIAKFRVPSGRAFWGKNFNAIPESALYPRGDRIKKLCDDIGKESFIQIETGDIGDFLQLWELVESYVIERAEVSDSSRSVLRALQGLRKYGNMDKKLISDIDHLRQFRNTLVHSPTSLTSKQIATETNALRKVGSSKKYVGSHWSRQVAKGVI